MAGLPFDPLLGYFPRSKFYPTRITQCFRRPRRTMRALGNAPISVRFSPFQSNESLLIPTVVLFSYNTSLYGNRICIWARDESEILKCWDRCRLVANYLWHLMQRTTKLYCNIPVDLGDGYDHSSSNVFCFSRRIGLTNPLLPNPYLLRPRRRLSRPMPFEKKQDVLYFRGSSTGDLGYESNRRVSLCLAAKAIASSDCYISHVVQVGPLFAERLAREGLIRRPDAVEAMNRCRMVVDVDGNTSSWDRFLSIASFGSVPIRFETAFEECWHSLLVEGKHYIASDRKTLHHVVMSLRENVPLAEQIAINALEFARDYLSPVRIREWFEQAWLTHADPNATKLIA